jgi:hypothetical protein
VRAASPPNTPGIARLRTRATQQAPSEQERRRLWTAVSNHSSVCVRSTPTSPPSPQAPSEQERRRLWTAVSNHSSLCVRSTPTRASPFKQPKALDCCENHSSPCVRSTPTRPPNAPLVGLISRSAPSAQAPPNTPTLSPQAHVHYSLFTIFNPPSVQARLLIPQG